MEHSTTPKSGASSTVSTAWDDDDLVGKTFDDFRVLRRLGEGGMGRVYLAEQISLKRNVAIKVLRPDIATPTLLARFRAESTMTAQLSHANVVQAHTVGEHQGRHYLVMEYVDGVSLRHYLVKKGPLDLPLALSVLRRVASALQRASELGIVHRDIKPENILLTRKAEVKVADFGLARCLTLDEPLGLTRAGTTVGTPRYISPEQVQSKPVDQRTDIYSLGVTCYEMLTGQPPHDGSSAFEIASKHVHAEPVALEKLRPGLPQSVCAIVRKMMAKDPDQRFASAKELLKELARAREALGDATAAIPAVPAGNDTVEEEREPAPPTFWQRVVARPWILAVSGVGALLLVVVVIVVVAIGSGGDPPAARTGNSAATEAPKPRETAPKIKDREAALKKKEREAALVKLAEAHLNDNAPNPSGVEACINLGVFYLDESKVAEAETLFKRMSKRQPPSAYHFVGRLGLAVVDTLKDNDRQAREKFKELLDPNPKTKDTRAGILNDYMTKNPRFAEWVMEAESHVGYVAAGTPATKTPRPPTGGLPGFGKLKPRRP